MRWHARGGRPSVAYKDKAEHNVERDGWETRTKEWWRSRNVRNTTEEVESVRDKTPGEMDHDEPAHYADATDSVQ